MPTKKETEKKKTPTKKAPTKKPVSRSHQDIPREAIQGKYPSEVADSEALQSHAEGR